jgi:hypothetical protein
MLGGDLSVNGDSGAAAQPQVLRECFYRRWQSAEQKISLR